MSRARTAGVGVALLCAALCLAGLIGWTAGIGSEAGSSAGAEGKTLWYATPPEGSQVPPEGRFALRPLHGPAVEAVPGISLGSGIVPRVFGFQVDYAGPHEWIEVVVENRDGETILSESVVFRQRFGSGEMKRRGNTTDYSDGPAHARPRQNFLLRLVHVEGDGDPNAHLTVAAFDATEQAFADLFQCSLYTVQYDRALDSNGSYQPGGTIASSFSDPIHPDDSIVPLYRMSRNDGRYVTTFSVRFR